MADPSKLKICAQCGKTKTLSEMASAKGVLCRDCKDTNKAETALRAGAASPAQIKPKRAKEILEARGITNPRILEVCIEHAQIAARNLRIPFNEHLLKFGLQKTLEAIKTPRKKIEPPPTESEWQPGERVRPHELHALWDYSCSWRKQSDIENFGETISYDAWLAMRRRSITDTVWFANTVLGKSFEQEPHGRWAKELFPQLEPALLSLPEKLTQKAIAKAFNLISDIKVRCLISARSSFKALALGTIVQTPQGRKRIADVHPGDQVFGEDGQPKLVVGESEVFTDNDCYEIEFSTGEKVVADAGHLWKVQSRSIGRTLSDGTAKGTHNRWHIQRGITKPNCGYCNGTTADIPKAHQYEQVITTEKMAKTFKYGKRRDRNHAINLAAPVMGDERTFLINPYVLGAWLGDGTSSEGHFTIDERDAAVVEALTAIEGTASRRFKQNTTWCYRFGAKGSLRGNRDSCLKARLRAMGVLNDKHIPEEYFLGSVEQRFELLRGLMDTDGTCSEQGHSTFVNTNKRLAEDVRRLACSLGFKASITEYRARLNGQDAGPMWYVAFFALHDTPVFRLERKHTRQRKNLAKGFQRSIVSVRKVDSVPTKCLSVEGGMFLITDSYIPTHNSTYSTVFAMQMMLCFAGSLRMMIVTATQPLAKAFSKGFRNMLTLRDPNNAPLFAQLFPEHFVGPDEGKSLEYTSPFRELDMLLEPTLGALSVISEGSAGFRYDYGIFDDCAEISNSSNVEMRANTQTRVDMLRELGEPHSLTTYVGTPISPGQGTPEDPGDLYSVLLMREAKNQKEGGEPKLLSTICPAWKVKPGIKKKAWDITLKEEDVELLFPNRLTYKYILGKLKESLATDPKAKIFRQQSLVSWVPDNEDDHLKCAFDHDELWDKVRVGSYFGAPAASKTFLVFDRGWSISKWADFSCGVIGSVQIVNGKLAVVIKDIRLIRERESGVVKMICELIQKWSPSAFISQKDRGFEDLCDAIRVGCMRRGIPTPWLRSIPIDSSDRAKARRVKALENPISQDHIFFVDGIPDLETALLQLENFDGVTSSNSHRKDDFPDTLAILWSQSGIRLAQEMKVETDAEEEKRKANEAEKQFEADRRRAMYQAMHGSATVPKPVEPPPEPPPAQPRQSFPRGGNFATLPGSMRGKPRY